MDCRGVARTSEDLAGPAAGDEFLPLERFFEALAWGPVRSSVALGLFFAALLYATVLVSGDLAVFRASGRSLLEDRDARIGVLLILLAAYLPVARHQIVLGGRQDVAALRASSLWRSLPTGEDGAYPPAPDRRRSRLVGATCVLIVPLTAISIDRDPGLYLQAYYWRAIVVWSWLAGGFVAWHAGLLFQSILAWVGCFGRIARERVAIDLLDLDALGPFARQGLRHGLPAVILLSFYALNSGDQGFGWAIGTMGGLTLGLLLPALVWPMWGVHQAIRREKQREFARIRPALRGEPGSLAGSPIAGRGEAPSLADLVAWRGLVADVREWPFDATVALRLLLYLALPLGSWLGGALVERLLDAALD
jgi:hypothetical protein